MNNQDILDSLGSFGFNPTFDYLIVKLEDNDDSEVVTYGVLTNIGIITKPGEKAYCYDFKDNLLKLTTISKIWVTNGIVMVDHIIGNLSCKIKGDKAIKMESMITRLSSLIYDGGNQSFVNDKDEKTNEIMSKYGLV